MTDPLETTVTLSESSQLAQKGKRWVVTVARPGKGATGDYSEAVLRESGPRALPAGTKSFFKHADTEDRDPRDQVGVFEEGAFWNEEEGELQAILTPFPRYAEVLEQAKENIEASIKVAARRLANSRVVKELVYRRDNTVDLVAFAGLEGSGLKYQVESLFASVHSDGEDIEKKENSVEITKEMWDGLTASQLALTNTFNTFVTESAREVRGVADDAAVETAVAARIADVLEEYAATESAIEQADIPVTVKESLKARARKGEDIADALADSITIVVETKKDLKPVTRNRNDRSSVVVVSESLRDDTPRSFKVGQWSKN